MNEVITPKAWYSVVGGFSNVELSTALAYSSEKFRLVNSKEARRPREEYACFESFPRVDPYLIVASSDLIDDKLSFIISFASTTESTNETVTRRLVLELSGAGIGLHRIGQKETRFIGNWTQLGLLKLLESPERFDQWVRGEREFPVRVLKIPRSPGHLHS